MRPREASMRLITLLFLVALVFAPFSANSGEMTRGETTDWAEFKWNPQDPTRLCVIRGNSLYCPRNRILVLVQGRKVMDKDLVLELQRLQRTNRPEVSRLDTTK